jgi:hypothetical protein
LLCDFLNIENNFEKNIVNKKIYLPVFKRNLNNNNKKNNKKNIIGVLLLNITIIDI